MYHSIAVFCLFSPFKIQKGKRYFMLIFCADSIYCKCAQNLTYFQFGMAAAHKQSKICSFFGVCSSNSMQNKVLKKIDSEEPINILTECTCAMHIGIRTYVWQICFCSHHFHSYSIFFCKCKVLKLNFPIKIVVGFVIAAAAVAATPSIQWKMPIRMVRLRIELTNFGALLLMRGRFIFKMVNLPANRWIMALSQTDQNKNWDGQYVHVCSLFWLLIKRDPTVSFFSLFKGFSFLRIFIENSIVFVVFCSQCFSILPICFLFFPIFCVWAVAFERSTLTETTFCLRRSVLCSMPKTRLSASRQFV